MEKSHVRRLHRYDCFCMFLLLLEHLRNDRLRFSILHVDQHCTALFQGRGLGLNDAPGETTREVLGSAKFEFCPARCDHQNGTLASTRAAYLDVTCHMTSHLNFRCTVYIYIIYIYIYVYGYIVVHIYIYNQL